MKFNTFERLVLLNVLSQSRNNLADLKIVHHLKMDLTFTEKEQKLSKMKFTDKGTIADWTAVKPKEIKLSDRAKEIITKGLENISNQEKLTEEHFTLCEKFGLFKGEK